MPCTTSSQSSHHQPHLHATDSHLPFPRREGQHQWGGWNMYSSPVMAGGDPPGDLTCNPRPNLSHPISRLNEHDTTTATPILEL